MVERSWLCHFSCAGGLLCGCALTEVGADGDELGVTPCNHTSTRPRGDGCDGMVAPHNGSDGVSADDRRREQHDRSEMGVERVVDCEQLMLCEGDVVRCVAVCGASDDQNVVLGEGDRRGTVGVGGVGYDEGGDTDTQRDVVGCVAVAARGYDEDVMLCEGDVCGAVAVGGVVDAEHPCDTQRDIVCAVGVSARGYDEDVMLG